MLNKKKGFSLIELLVVIAIIGMLAATVLVSLGTARAKGRDAKRIADLKNLELAITLYSDSNLGKVPETLQELVTGDFIKQLPKDPNTDSDYSYAAYYKVSDAPSLKCIRYHLGANLENMTTVHAGDADLKLEDLVDKALLPCGGPNFNGEDQYACGAFTASEEYCYDLTN